MKKLGLGLLFVILFCNLQAGIIYRSDSENKISNLFDNDPVEQETFSFQAKVIGIGASQVDMNKLVADAISASYKAYEPDFHMAMTQVTQTYAGMGSGGSFGSNFENSKILVVKSFATVIINQLDTLAQQLSAKDKQTFWNIAEQQMKIKFADLCTSYGPNHSKMVLNEHIENLIEMKKIFG